VAQPQFIPSDERILERGVVYDPVPADGVENGVVTIVWTGDKITTERLVLNSETFERTFSYTGDDLTGISAWTRS